MAENLIKSDEELGLNKKIHPYTGFYLVDFILNHHMTPLFTLNYTDAPSEQTTGMHLRRFERDALFAFDQN